MDIFLPREELHEFEFMSIADVCDLFKRGLKSSGGLTNYCEDHDLPYRVMVDKLDRNKVHCRPHYIDIVSITRTGSTVFLKHLAAQLPDSEHAQPEMTQADMHRQLCLFMHAVGQLAVAVQAGTDSGRPLDAISARTYYDDVHAIQVRAGEIMRKLRPHFQLEDPDKVAVFTNEVAP
ncbi:hypothetical protein [Desulfovibrio inopinatus]|uniref:hypothetical protein n=1 Tax=Desulfovibrio inopinatus TaxID=102109 RepID=UPI0004223D45|nr:hypothetical protein [Desulfovibrio inopinatus]